MSQPPAPGLTPQQPSRSWFPTTPGAAQLQSQHARGASAPPVAFGPAPPNATSTSAPNQLTSQLKRLENANNQLQTTNNILDVRVKELNAKIADLEQQKAAANRAKLEADATNIKSKKFEERLKEQADKYAALEAILQEERKQHGIIRTGHEQTQLFWKTRLDNLESDKELLRQRLGETEHEIKQRDDTVAMLQQTIRARDVEALKLQSALRDLEIKYSSLDASKKQADQDNERTKEATSKLQARLNDKENELGQALHRIAAAELSFDEQSRKLTTLTQQLIETRAEVEVAKSQRDAAFKEQQYVASSSEELNVTLNRYINDLRAAADHAASLDHEIAATKLTLLHTERDLTAKSNSLEELQKKFNQLKENFNAKEQLLFAEQMKSTELQAQHALLETRCNMLTSKAENTKVELEKKDAELRTMKSSQEGATREVRDFEARISELQSAIRQVEGELQKQEESHNATVLSFEEKLISAQQKIESERRLRETMQSELETFNKQHRSITSEQVATVQLQLSTEKKALEENLSAVTLQRDAMKRAFEERIAGMEQQHSQQLRVLQEQKETDAKTRAQETLAKEDEHAAAVASLSRSYAAEVEALERTITDLRNERTQLEEEVRRVRQHAADQENEFAEREKNQERHANLEKVAWQKQTADLLHRKDEELQKYAKATIDAQQQLDQAIRRHSEAQQATSSKLQASERDHRAAIEKQKEEYNHEKQRHAAYKTAHEELLGKYRRLKAMRDDEIRSFQKANAAVASSRDKIAHRFVTLKDMYTALDADFVALCHAWPERSIPFPTLPSSLRMDATATEEPRRLTLHIHQQRQSRFSTILDLTEGAADQQDDDAKKSLVTVSESYEVDPAPEDAGRPTNTRPPLFPNVGQANAEPRETCVIGECVPEAKPAVAPLGALSINDKKRSRSTAAGEDLTCAQDVPAQIQRPVRGSHLPFAARPSL